MGTKPFLTANMGQIYCIYITDKCNSCKINAVCNQHMMHEPNKAFQIMGGMCPGGMSGGYVSRG